MTLSEFGINVTVSYWNVLQGKYLEKYSILHTQKLTMAIKTNAWAANYHTAHAQWGICHCPASIRLQIISQCSTETAEHIILKQTLVSITKDVCNIPTCAKYTRHRKICDFSTNNFHILVQNTDTVDDLKWHSTIQFVTSGLSLISPTIAMRPFLVAVQRLGTLHGAYGVETTASAAWVGAHGKVRLCPSVVNILVFSLAKQASVAQNPQQRRQLNQIVLDSLFMYLIHNCHQHIVYLTCSCQHRNREVNICNPRIW